MLPAGDLQPAIPRIGRDPPERIDACGSGGPAGAPRPNRWHQG